MKFAMPKFLFRPSTLAIVFIPIPLILALLYPASFWAMGDYEPHQSRQCVEPGLSARRSEDVHGDGNVQSPGRPLLFDELAGTGAHGPSPRLGRRGPVQYDGGSYRDLSSGDDFPRRIGRSRRHFCLRAIGASAGSGGGGDRRIGALAVFIACDDAHVCFAGDGAVALLINALFFGY